jgi:3-hydroxyisobutyrate dehydrogenase-like beta-hydroxyacid dehydrogenase
VYDIDPAALEAARGQGAEVVSSAKAVAEASNLIHVVVRTDQEVLDCTKGKQGVLEGAKPGSLVLAHSTVLPQTTRAVADAGRPLQVDVIDACMVGVPRVVREGHVSFLVGGPADLVNRARPHLLRMGKQVLHMGPVGAGNVAKLIKNLVTGAETLVIHEAVQLGEAAGIPYRDSLEMMRQVYSDTLLNHWQRTFDPSAVHATPHIGHNIFEKDIPLASELARQLGVEIPITEALLSTARRLLNVKS